MTNGYLTFLDYLELRRRVEKRLASGRYFLLHIIIFMVEMALGVVARNLPQMNMFAIGIPVKIIVGLVTLSLWFAGIGGVMTRVYRGIYTTWDSILTVDAPQGTVPEVIHGR